MSFFVSFLSTSQDIGCEEHLQNDVFCDEWDVKSQLHHCYQCLPLRLG